MRKPDRPKSDAIFRPVVPAFHASTVGVRYEPRASAPSVSQPFEPP